MIRRGAGDTDAALADFGRAIELDPRNVEARFNRGSVWHDIARFDEAIAEFDQIILFAPRDMRAWFNRGNSRYSKGDHMASSLSLGRVALPNSLRMSGGSVLSFGVMILHIY